MKVRLVGEREGRSSLQRMRSGVSPWTLWRVSRCEGLVTWADGAGNRGAVYTPRGAAQNRVRGCDLCACVMAYSWMGTQSRSRPDAAAAVAKELLIRAYLSGIMYHFIYVLL